MAKWVLDGERRESLADPALGLGIFARAVARESAGAHRLSGFELDPAMAGRAAALLAGLPDRIALRIERGDYLDSNWDARFDGILCNPPYLRFQEYPGRSARIKAFEDRMGLKLAGLTNIHCLFLLKSLHQLAPGGRAAYILPWEFLNAGYGARIKEYLLASGSLRHAVVFDSRPGPGLFAGAVTTACILLFGRACPPGPASGTARGRSEVAFHRASADQDLGALYRERIAAPAAAPAPGVPPSGASPAGSPSAGAPSGMPGTRILPMEGLDPAVKWKEYWRVASPAGYRNMAPIGDFACVLRGIATGCNDFFTLDEAAARAASLPDECLLPCVARARDAAGPFFRTRDFEALKARGGRVWLLDAEGRRQSEVLAYLAAGLRDKVHERFLTRHRSPWYALEKREPAPLWVSVFNRDGGLKPVLNRAGVRNLTAFHCVYPRPGAEAWMDALFAWLLTGAARAIVRENGREYGAGLEKIEPKDLAGARAPDFSRMSAGDLEEIGALVAGMEARCGQPEPSGPGLGVVGQETSLIQEIFLKYL